MKLTKHLMAATAIAITLFACKKQIDNSVTDGGKLMVDPAKVFRQPQSPSEKELVINIGTLTEILKNVYESEKNRQIVNAAIASKSFKDESVFISDLIYPKESRLITNARFKKLTQKLGLDIHNFATSFWKAAENYNTPDFKAFLGEEQRKMQLRNQAFNLTLAKGLTTQSDVNGGDGVTIYFPYNEEFLPEDPGTGNGGSYGTITTLVTATADADEGIGDLPFYVNGIYQYSTQVLVNDAYCQQNPTHIIGVNGIEPYDGPLDPASPPPPPPPPPGVSRVYIGEAVCKKNYDRLISFTGNGGGSEIKFCRLSGFLQPVNGQVTSFQDIASYDFKRGTISNKIWSKSYILWDDDWQQSDNEQVLAIYEEDNTNTKTFNGSLGTTITISPGTTATGTVGFNVTVVSQDEIIRQLKISRNSYFAGAFQDQGKDFSQDATFLPLPFTHGWPAYDVHYWNKTGADVGWTWPYNTF